MNESTWLGILLRKTMEIYTALRKKEKDGQANFIKKNAKLIAKLQAVEEDVHNAGLSYSQAEGAANNIRALLSNKAIDAGLSARERSYTKRETTKKAYKPRPWVIESQLYNPQEQIGFVPVVRNSPGRDLEAFLGRSKHAAYKTLLVKYQDLRISIELANDEESKELVKAFLAAPIAI